MSSENPKISGVLLSGAAAIARYLYGDDSRSHCRRVYHIAASGQLPIFTLNGKLTARSASLDRAIEERERAACAPDTTPAEA